MHDPEGRLSLVQFRPVGGAIDHQTRSARDRHLSSIGQAHIASLTRTGRDGHRRRRYAWRSPPGETNPHGPETENQRHAGGEQARAPPGQIRARPVAQLRRGLERLGAPDRVGAQLTQVFGHLVIQRRQPIEDLRVPPIGLQPSVQLFPVREAGMLDALGPFTRFGFDRVFLGQDRLHSPAPRRHAPLIAPSP